MMNPLAASYAPFWRSLCDTPLSALADGLRAATDAALSSPAHGDADAWLNALAALPVVQCRARLDLDAVTAEASAALPLTTRAALENALQALHPWRKGPFELAGVAIDSEWRSDWKWRRVAPHLAPLAGQCVLDVGAGNGYYALRLVGGGARVAVGVDPSLLYCTQAAAALHFLGGQPAHVLPLRLQDLPVAAPLFDTVLSMGVLYHQRAPLDHLQQLGAWLQPGGQLVLETLVIDGGADSVLVPRDRYARMRNVWFLPSPMALERWLVRCGFVDVACVDTSVTTPAEQRTTPWMRFQSLREALAPDDPTSTIEGHPAPRRAVLIGTKR